MWGNDGRELFFISLNSEVMVVSVDGSGEQFRAGSIETFFPVSLWNLSGTGFDVSNDGQQLLINTFADVDEAPIRLVVDRTSALDR